jgi:hypothetical protein
MSIDVETELLAIAKIVEIPYPDLSAWVLENIMYLKYVISGYECYKIKKNPVDVIPVAILKWREWIEPIQHFTSDVDIKRYYADVSKPDSLHPFIR